MSTPPSDIGEAPENPLEAVFEKAVRPFPDAKALRASLPADAPVVTMRKDEEVPTATRELEGGGTLTIPVLGALKDSSMAGWQRASGFDFDALPEDGVALAVVEGADGELQLRVVTRAERGAFLVADLSGMVDALKVLVDNPAFRAFPGGEILVEALVSGLRAAQEDISKGLREKGPDGAPSLFEQFKAGAAASVKARKPRNSKGT